MVSLQEAGGDGKSIVSLRGQEAQGERKSLL